MRAASLAAALLLGGTAGAAAAEDRTLPLDGCSPVYVLPAGEATHSFVFCQEGTPRLLDESTGEAVEIGLDRSEAESRGWASAIALSPDGTLLAIAFRNGEVIAWKADGSIAVNWKRDFYAQSLAFTPDGRALYIDGVAEALGAHSPLPSLTGSFDTPNVVLFGAGDVYAVQADTRIEKVPLAAGSPRVVADDELVEGLSAALSGNGKLLFVGMADGRIVTRNAQTLETVHTAQGAPGTMISALAALGDDRAVAMFRPQIGGPGATFALLGSDGTLQSVPGGDEILGLARRDGDVMLYIADAQGLKLRAVRLVAGP